MKIRILALVLIIIIFISLFLNYSSKEGLEQQHLKLLGEYVDLTGQHSLCKNPTDKPVCNKKEGCGKGYVNLGLETPKDLNSYRCSNPTGSWQYLSTCPGGHVLSKNARGCLRVKYEE
jgi:hypothetical protein